MPVFAPVGFCGLRFIKGFKGRYDREIPLMTDRIDQSLTMLWAVLGTGVILKPTGYVGWTDLALWCTASWLVALGGLCYLRLSATRA